MKHTFLHFTAVAVILISCHDAAKNMGEPLRASKAVVVDASPGSCAGLTKDGMGNIILSFTREISDTQSVVCYAISKDHGSTFGKPVEIAASANVHPHAENLPKLLCKPSGEMIAAWGTGNPNPNNAYSGLVYYAQSFNGGKSWSAARPLVTDPASYDQRYFDMALLPNGEAAIVWLDNRKKTAKTGSAIYYAATNGDHGFENEKYISGSCCECCRTDLYVDSKSYIHISFRGLINDSIRDMMHTVSIDGGRSFGQPQRLSEDNWMIKGCPHTGPAMVENGHGLHFAWYTMGSGSGLYFCTSSDNGKAFSPRGSIRNKAAARHPQMVSLPDGAILIVWDETAQQPNGQGTGIVVQKRSAEGRPVFTRYITSDTLRSAYPVVQAVDDHTVLIAYGQNRNDKSHVVYQTVSLE